MTDTLDIMQLSPVIPVATINDLEDAVPMAQALYEGGIKTIEVTQRTPVAMDALRSIAREVPDLCLGVGTVWTREQARQAHEAGAQFMVSPAIADEVGAYCQQAGMPYLPGAQTASEIAHLVRQGWQQIKLFPAAVAGGPAALKAFAAVFPEVSFCPTGGINEDNAADYLALSCVPCVGGSWLTKDTDPVVIRQAAEQAVRLGQPR